MKNINIGDKLMCIVPFHNILGYKQVVTVRGFYDNNFVLLQTYGDILFPLAIFKKVEGEKTMKKYVRTNLVDAELMNLGEYNKMRGWELPKDEDPNTEGYVVKYKDGYTSWCPKDVFEQQAVQVGDNNTITKELVNYFMDLAQKNVHTVDNKTTIVHCVLPNGFTMVESSSCVDPANYDVAIGTEICLERMRNQLWGLLGFLLQTAKEGVR